MSALYSDEFLESLTVVGFIIGVLNYDENLSQSDKQEMIQSFDNKIEKLLEHLDQEIDEQNSMLKDIIERLDRLEQRRPNQ